MRSRVLRVHVMLVVLLAAAISPCMPGPVESAPCDMPGCHDMQASMQASCCCKTPRTSTESGQRVLPPKPAADAAPMIADGLLIAATAAAPAAVSVAMRAPEPVPLYLLNCSLLS